MQGYRTNRLSSRELAAWRGMLRVHASLVYELDHELEETHGLPLHQYEVLLLLADADGGQLRMSDLAAGVLLSQSGLTRLVDRLEGAGLVERRRCQDDRRGLYASITDEGRTRFDAARATHLAGVRQRFLSRLADDQLDALVTAWERVLPGSAS